jgi:hypothetical protein
MRPLGSAGGRYNDMNINVKLLRKIAKHITDKPRRFVMRTFMYSTDGWGDEFRADDGSMQKFEKCGTVACIGGWAVLLTDGVAPTGEIRARAVEILGIQGMNEDKLFEVTMWPTEFTKRYWAAKTQRQRAKVAAERIEHFIATEGVE